MRYQELPAVQDLLPGIRSRAQDLDVSGDWPQTDLDMLATIGAMRWAAPVGCAGEELSLIELHFRYEAIASASLAVALALSQRDSAVDLIAGAADSPFRNEVLPKLAANEIFATIGIAQLTTSRQGGPPVFRATRVDGGYRVDGYIPWCTGAGKSQYIVAGAALEDGKQVLFALPTDLAGVRIEPPLPLVALRASWTSRVECDGAILPERFVLAANTDRALANRKRSIPLGQTFLALGLGCGGLDVIATHDSDRARTAHERFDAQHSAIRREVLDLCAPGNEKAAGEAAPQIRGRINELVLRITHAAVTLFKGSALLSNHPAQRLAREAMFLLVWSCPNPVIDCTVEMLSQE